MPVKSAIKNIVASGLDSRGYELKEKAAPPRGFRAFLKIYNRRMRKPRSVFDVGVGRGTNWLYESFPEAALVLVEPLSRFEPQIREIVNARGAVWQRCALGDAPGEATMLVPRGAPTGASLLRRSPSREAAPSNGLEEETVPVRLLDEIAAKAEPPFVLKLDVEGAEVGVLRGGQGALRSTDLVIVEASVGPRHEGESDLIDIGAALKPHGFKLAEIIEMATRGPDKLLSYLDAAFVRADGGFWNEG